MSLCCADDEKTVGFDALAAIFFFDKRTFIAFVLNSVVKDSSNRTTTWIKKIKNWRIALIVRLVVGDSMEYDAAPNTYKKP